MATLEINLLGGTPHGNGMQITVDQPTPLPAFVEFEDADGTHRYLPASELESERALNAEMLRALRAVKTVHEGYVWGLGHGGGGGHFALPEEVDIAIAKAEARNVR